MTHSQNRQIPSKNLTGGLKEEEWTAFLSLHNVIWALFSLHCIRDAFHVACLISMWFTLTSTAIQFWTDDCKPGEREHKNPPVWIYLACFEILLITHVCTSENTMQLTNYKDDDDNRTDQCRSMLEDDFVCKISHSFVVSLCSSQIQWSGVTRHCQAATWCMVRHPNKAQSCSEFCCLSLVPASPLWNYQNEMWPSISKIYGKIGCVFHILYGRKPKSALYAHYP